MSLIRQFILQDPNDNTRLGEFDNKFQVPIHISVEHHEIHEGDSFERHIDSANAAVATMNVAFKTLAGTKLAHTLFGYGMSDEVLIEIIEGATWTQGSGSLLTVFNHERDSGGSSELILENQGQPTFTASNAIIKDVTGIAGGTIFENQYTYNAGLGASMTAETRTDGHEWVLKANTTYIIRVTQTGGNCKMSIDLHWYEHTTE